MTTIHKLAELKTDLVEKFEQWDVLKRLVVEKDLLITRSVKIQHPTELVLLPFLPN